MLHLHADVSAAHLSASFSDRRNLLVVLPCRTGGVPPGMTALIAVMCSLGCLGIGAVLAVVIMRGTVDQQKQREKERQNVSRFRLKAQPKLYTKASMRNCNM